MLFVRKNRTSLLAAIIVVGFLVSFGSVNAQGLPPNLPAILGGTATSGGQPVPDGLIVVARIGSTYQTEAVVVSGGRYDNLLIAPPSETNVVGEVVRFFLDGTIQAAQTTTYQPGAVNTNLNLTFPSLPVPTPTPSPTPTVTPIPSPTPRVALPSVYSGEIVIAGGSVPRDAELVARVGSYISTPAAINGINYSGLVVDPGDFNLIGQPVEFLLNGVLARTTDVYTSGSIKRDFVIVFIGFPTPTPVPATPTPSPAPSPSTTPILAASPTATSTGTEPTATPGIAATATAEGESSGGSCSAPDVNAPITAGMTNFLVMLLPVIALATYRKFRR